MHDYDADKMISDEYADNPIWETIYRTYFPDYASMASVGPNSWGQKSGIDRVIILQSGKTVNVEEKVRYVDRDDIFLETVSVVEKNVPGWISKPAATDYLCYHFQPSKRTYMFPFLALRRTWSVGEPFWSRTYGIRTVENKNYHSQGICVPIDIMKIALGRCIEVTI